MVSNYIYMDHEVNAERTFKEVTYQRHVVVEPTDHPWIERKHSFFEAHL